MTTIENNALEVVINYKGAEMSSITNKSNDLEYLWQADPHHWSRHSPLLFPIVGRLLNDEYTLQNKNYAMSQHGVARDLDFELVESDAVSATFQLESNREIRLAYPFRFVLQVRYKLEDNEILISFKVVNNDPEKMFFSIGAHPAFNCPLHTSERRSDYMLQFTQKESLFTQRIKDGIRTGEVDQIGENSDVIEIVDDIFDQDAIIFSDLKSDTVSLVKNNTKLISVHFEGFPFLGIWSKSQESPFVCIEPWYGIADHINHNNRLEEKEGILGLDPGKFFETEYRITIH